MGSAGGHLFILFKYEIFVNAGSQAVRVAWVDIWGVRRVRGTLLLFSVLFASYALAPFSVLREFGSFEKVSSFAFRLACGCFCVLRSLLSGLCFDRRLRCVGGSWPRGINRQLP